MLKWTRRFVFVAAIVFAAPLVPVGVAGWAFRERRRGRPVLARLPTFIAALSRPGRVVFLVLACVGSELVAIEIVASTYFNAVDEHAASVVGVFVVLVLGIVVVVDRVVVHLGMGAGSHRGAPRDQPPA